MNDSTDKSREAELIPSRYLHRLFEVAEQRDVNLGPILTEHELNRDWVADKKNAVSHRKYLSVIETVLRETDDQDIGLSVGELIRPSDHGVLGYAMLASATLRKGFERFSKFQQILGPLIEVELVEKGKEAAVVGTEVFPLGAKYRFAVSSWAAENNHIRSLFDQSEMEFSLVRLTYPANGAEKRYEELLGCEVLFDQKINELRFSSEFLDAPFSLADSSVAELCVQQCERILGRLDEKTFLVDRVRRAVMARPGQIPTLDEVAETVNMTSRTLRRHLRSEGTCFSEIVNDVRMNLAAEYLLNTRFPPKEIAYLVGYSEVAAFHRAFQRHFEMTPIVYREDFLG